MPKLHPEHDSLTTQIATMTAGRVANQRALVNTSQPFALEQPFVVYGVDILLEYEVGMVTRIKAFAGKRGSSC